MNQLHIALQQHQSGDLDGAIATYRAILAEDPHQTDALHMMGIIAQQRGNSELALKLIDAALASDSSFATAWSNRALVLRVINRRKEALISAQKAIALDPSLADAWDMAGCLLRQEGRYDEARTHHQKAIQLQPKNVSFRSNYAVLLMMMDDIIGAYKTIIAPLNTSSGSPQHMPLILGNIVQAAGYPERAIDCYHKTFEQNPSLIDAQVNEALAHLKVGDFEEGWKRWQIRADGYDEFFNSIPRWDGEATEHLLLYEDQGLGDALQALRYVPLICERAKKITVYLMTDALASLIQSSFPTISVLVHNNQPIPHASARAQLMSLPYLLKTRLNSIPATVPYLTAPASSDTPWAQELSCVPSPRIGIVWAGNINYPNDRNRSLHFDQLSPLLKIARGHVLSLQKGIQKDQADFGSTHIMDADPWMKDFGLSAQLINQLDLVITVDTATAHLVGALGKAAWLLLPFDPDWRWMLNREDTPWYPTLRLFRQTKPGDWTSVIERLMLDMKAFLHGNRDVLKPSPGLSIADRINHHALILPD